MMRSGRALLPQLRAKCVYRWLKPSRRISHCAILLRKLNFVSRDRSRRWALNSEACFRSVCRLHSIPCLFEVTPSGCGVSCWQFGDAHFLSRPINRV